jgi:hypothetical protein
MQTARQYNYFLEGSLKFFMVAIFSLFCLATVGTPMAVLIGRAFREVSEGLVKVFGN